ncbi:MAG: hypothetical protein AB7N76_13725 [Planctomycetota bacterium]
MDDVMRALERSASLGDAEAQAQLDALRARLAEPASAVLEEHDRVAEALSEAFSAFRAAGHADFERYVVALLAREPELDALVLRGYTPGFCDGDRCEHTQDVLFGAVAEDDDEPPQLIPRERAATYERQLAEFEPVLHQMWGTNWQLTYRRGTEEGPLDMELIDWECGY